jgi:hypothetical protein
MGQNQLLAFKIHNNFISSDKITKVFAISIIPIVAPLKIFALCCTAPNQV